MHKGKIVEQGRTRDVLENPHDTYTRHLVEAAYESSAWMGKNR